ncbi:hypothetical protein HOY82DRAFT_610319 [Tuber indicum]|nr:hypothetical protein HOY82DRAFT_610319 [Tuber indicum]
MSSNRSHQPNVFFYNGTHPDIALGGLLQNESITEENFLNILGILLVVPAGPLSVQERILGHVVSRSSMVLETAIIQVSDEPWIFQLTSQIAPARQDQFSYEVRHWDRKCIISGLSNPELLIQANNWIGFVAITDIDSATGSLKINSPQNGFLLQVVFTMDFLYSDGRTLDPACCNAADPHCVSDQLLRWHFCQSVLANVRGTGEPTFEHDFPLGTDMLSEIQAGPYARERFELEIAARLRAVA